MLHSHGMQRPSVPCPTFSSHGSISDVQFVLLDLAASVGSGPTLLGDADNAAAALPLLLQRSTGEMFP